MKPNSIVAFEYAWFASMAIGLVHAAIIWDEIVAADPLPLWVMPAVMAFSLALFLGLVLLVSRRRSVVAKWVLVGLTLLGMIPFWPILETGLDSMRTMVEVAVATLQVGGTILLFTPSARAWLAGKREPRPAETLGRTFE